VASEQAIPSTALADDPETSARRDSELRRLQRLAGLNVGFVIVVAGGAIVGILVLFTGSTSSSLRDLALISILGGVLGGAGRNLVELLDRLVLGWEFEDGSVLDRRDARERRRLAELVALDERMLRARPPLPEKHPLDEEARRYNREREEIEGRLRRRQEQAMPSEHVWQDAYFGIYFLPFSLLFPLMGAILGFSLFAGVTGGLLLASGTGHPSYSSTGLLFLAFLAGFFSETFLRRLASAADALFGVQGSNRPGSGNRPDQPSNTRQ
jgi:hypothetical protein